MDIKTIYINSSNRSSGAIEDFTITLADEIFTNRPKSVKLLKASLPQLWPNIIDVADDAVFANNVFKFTGGATGDHTFTLAKGNYSASVLAQEIEDAMNAATNPGDYSVSFDTLTLKFTFASSVEIFTLDFTIANNLYERLGFTNNTTVASSALPSATVVSPNLAKIVIDYDIFIHSDLIAGSDNGVIPFTSNVMSSNEILARIPTTACPNALIDYTAHTQLPLYPTIGSTFSKILSSTESRAIRFYLTFPSGFPVLLQGFDWSAELIFSFNE